MFYRYVHFCGSLWWVVASYSSVARAERDEQCRTGPSKGFDLMAKNLDLKVKTPFQKKQKKEKKTEEKVDEEAEETLTQKEELQES